MASPVTPSVTISISVVIIKIDFLVSICVLIAITDNMNNSKLRIIGITCFFDVQKETALVIEVIIGIAVFFITLLSFQDFFWFDNMMITESAIMEIGITVTHAKCINLS
jgi:hypothetical protein